MVQFGIHVYMQKGVVWDVMPMSKTSILIIDICRWT